MSGFNMPPGVSPGDIPGNQPIKRRVRYPYFIHDARKPERRLDGPYTSRAKALVCSVKFNNAGIPTVIKELRS
jgi:hypothetical protein